MKDEHGHRVISAVSIKIILNLSDNIRWDYRLTKDRVKNKNVSIKKLCYFDKSLFSLLALDPHPQELLLNTP